MQSGPHNQNQNHRPAPGPELDGRAFEPFVVTPNDRFSRSILHYGVKAIAHAALAHRALAELEQPAAVPSRLIETFKVRGSPLSFSLAGLQASGIIVPTAAIAASNVFWPRFFSTPDRVGFAHPDFINPLLAQRGSPPQAPIPSSFFQLNWSKADLSERAKMGATLIVAERIWESCVVSYRQSTPQGEPRVGSIEQLLNYYSGYLSSLKLGDSRTGSLAAGEAFLASLVRRDEAVAARVLRQAQSAAFLEDPAALEAKLPPRPTPTEKTWPKNLPSKPSAPLPPTDRLELENLKRLRALGEFLTHPDPEQRAEGTACLKQWRGDFSPAVRKEVSRLLRLAARIDRSMDQIDVGRDTFARGDTAEGIRIIEEIATKSDIPLIRNEARDLLKRFRRILTTLARHEEPTDEWPKAGLQRRLSDVILAAYNHGSDAEVICHDGLKRAGRLCFGGVTPRSLKLLDFGHELTWEIDLTTIQSIRFFYDKEGEQPIRPRASEK